MTKNKWYALPHPKRDFAIKKKKKNTWWTVKQYPFDGIHTKLQKLF
jgi:hypothetical protein